MTRNLQFVPIYVKFKTDIEHLQFLEKHKWYHYKGEKISDFKSWDGGSQGWEWDCVTRWKHQEVLDDVSTCVFI